jgi:hypothetical protein
VSSAVELPHTVRLSYQPWPEEEGECVEFRLVYKGKLPPQGTGGGGSHLREKHHIRRQVHLQLKELWERHQVLRRFAEGVIQIDDAGVVTRTRRWEFLAKEYTKYGYRFLPLVNNIWGLGCSIDIVFLRRDDPGKLIVDGGDLDNRMKVLFDGLRIPQYNHEIEGFPPAPDEEPFYCLLENDNLITDVSVTTDRLLLPIEQDEHIKDVHLLLHITTKILDGERALATWGSML